MPLPPHLAEPVRFDHAAAAAAATLLRDLAGRLDDVATARQHGLVALDDFRGGRRQEVEDLTARLGRRAAALVQALHAEASAIEEAAVTAHRDAAALATARERWWAEQRRLVG